MHLPSKTKLASIGTWHIDWLIFNTAVDVWIIQDISLMTATIKWFLTDQSQTSFPITWSFSLQFKWKTDITKKAFSLKSFSQHAHLRYHQFPKSPGYHGRDRQCFLQPTQVNICCGFHFDGSLYLFSLRGISSTALGIRALWWALFTHAISLPPTEQAHEDGSWGLPSCQVSAQLVPEMRPGWLWYTWVRWPWIA